MKLDPAKGPDTKNWAQCKIQSLIWLLERITRDIRTMSEESRNVSDTTPSSIFATFQLFSMKTLATFINVPTLK